MKLHTIVKTTVVEMGGSYGVEFEFDDGYREWAMWGLRKPPSSTPAFSWAKPFRLASTRFS
jgi:hypothetical protein